MSYVLAAASCSSSTVFASFYLSNVQFSSSPGFSLGPVVAAGSVVYDFNGCFYPFLYVLYSWEWVPSGGEDALSPPLFVVL